MGLVAVLYQRADICLEYRGVGDFWTLGTKGDEVIDLRESFNGGNVTPINNISNALTSPYYTIPPTGTCQKFEYAGVENLVELAGDLLTEDFCPEMRYYAVCDYSNWEVQGRGSRIYYTSNTSVISFYKLDSADSGGAWHEL